MLELDAQHTVVDIEDDVHKRFVCNGEAMLRSKFYGFESFDLFCKFLDRFCSLNKTTEEISSFFGVHIF